MNTAGHHDEFDFSHPAELAELEKRWQSGQLQPQTERVWRFVGQHRDEIVPLAGEPRDAAALLQATQSLIRDRQTIDHAAEAEEERREINNEIWYQGEKGNYDRVAIACNWARDHAASWRRWTIKQYLFIVERCAFEIVARLTANAVAGHGAEPCRL
jgi:hypothetical protein